MTQPGHSHSSPTSKPSSHTVARPPAHFASPPPTLPPPAYSYSTPLTATLPLRTEAPVLLPTAELPTAIESLPPLSEALQSNNDRTLPPLSSLTGDHHARHPHKMTASMDFPPAPLSHTQWPGAVNPMTPHHQQSATPSLNHPQKYMSDSPDVMDLDTMRSGPMSAVSPDGRLDGRAGSVNIDDPDVRLAAEALGDLRADFVSSPSHMSASLPLSPPAPTAQPATRSQSPQGPEPLFSLLTTSHPFLATTIEGATSAYGGAKNFSPRFKSGAEYVEGYLTPIANTVGSVGRVTGVEGGVRWFLGAGRRQRSDVETGASSKKRRKVESEAEMMSRKRLEAEGLASPPQASHPSTPKDSRRMSFASTVDTLPAYDDARSPAYTETNDSQSSQPNEQQQANPAWQSRLIMSTSGLSVAMSDESLRSLKYCLRWLRWANDHIGGVVGNLKTTLEQYEKPPAEAEQGDSVESARADGDADEQMERATSPETRAELATRINTLKGDVLKTLQDAINMVSRYAGGALPENARILVRRHLTSLPQRFRVAAMSESNNAPGAPDSDSAVRDGAQRVLLLAKEGLDMVSQVSGVLDGTIVSAEEWCERIGKKRRDSREAQEQPILPQTEPNGDVKMG
ncbi:unnamed protein product [Clonostachys rosea]|uniref:Clock-controlled protein 8 n=1 Tax=Bionectria ochroleuca TaxID=29856 RepID=A0ABY6V6U4_BIOOC|nr:unnamed protein product [Clonostachys rosea]